MAAQAQGSCCRREALIVAAWIFAGAVAIAAVVLLCVFLDHKFPEEDPKFSVAVAAVAGLDPALDLSDRGRPTLSPVFNVTVHIDNTRNAHDRACVPDLSTAEVSYTPMATRSSAGAPCQRPAHARGGRPRAR
ncbi:unnamed protein product [Urochloa humidicola]